jgi:multidrug transporter EmrE-like cation transporter
VFAILSFLVHTLVPPDVSIAYFLWVRFCVVLVRCRSLLLFS